MVFVEAAWKSTKSYMVERYTIFGVSVNHYKPLHPYAIDDRMDAVDPAEAQRFFHGIQVIKYPRNGSPALQTHPTLIFAVYMPDQPLPEPGPIVTH